MNAQAMTKQTQAEQDRNKAIAEALNSGTAQVQVERSNVVRPNPLRDKLREVVSRNLDKPGAKWTPETGWTNDPA